MDADIIPGLGLDRAALDRARASRDALNAIEQQHSSGRGGKMSTRIVIGQLMGIIGFVIASAAAGAASTEDPLQEGDVFPGLEAESLAEEMVDLPHALQDSVGIVIFTFSKDGGEAAAAWVRAINDRFTEEGPPDIWQVMVLDDVPRLIRGVVVGGIKRGIPDARHPRSLTLYEDGASWRNRCSIESDDTPCVMLLDTGGKILWIRTDAVTDILVDDLERNAHAALPAADSERSEVQSGNAPRGSFLAVLNAHLQAIQNRDLDVLLDTITTGDDLVLIFPDGTMMDTRQAFVDFHKSWFADPAWRMEMEILRVIEQPVLAHALIKYRNVSPADDGRTRTSVNYVAMTFATEDGQWRLVFDQNTPIKVLLEDTSPDYS